MNIGILTYHWCPNFGAQLQALSTVTQLKTKGIKTFTIDYRPPDTEKAYENAVTPTQRRLHDQFVEEYLNPTNRCKNSQEIAGEIKRLSLDAVIIGSDSLFNLMTNSFSVRKLKFVKPHSDNTFPNPFWGDFTQYVDLPIAALSVSSQNSPFEKFKNRKKEIAAAIRKFRYISVRDKWTSEMISFFTDKEIVPTVTPDPVFGLDDKCYEISKNSILEKYSLRNKYILLSFFGGTRYSINPNWVKDFRVLAEHNGYTCVNFPSPSGAQDIELDNNIKLPLSPLEWYFLIKYSSAYVGMLMHPIVISIHNKVPFYSFDHYGTNILGSDMKWQTRSKIQLLLSDLDIANHSSRFQPLHSIPSPNYVFEEVTKTKESDMNSWAEKMYTLCQDNFNKIIGELAR
ncbi:MAG: polysaccharide pyruvyl transferase family protein [Lentisphaerae bacterium]|nr:polysaccharide pyruvyl transferase family protein [Lentisphaerota bacterium]